MAPITLPPHHMHNEPDPYAHEDEAAARVEEINRLYELVCTGLQKLIVQLDEHEAAPAHNNFSGSTSAEMTLRLEQLENTEMPQ
jgi:hypothetical protein